MPPARAEFEQRLTSLLTAAHEQGKPEVVVSAEELHRDVGGYPGGDHRMPMCCSVMKAAMRLGDSVAASPTSGQGASFAVRYRLPRACSWSSRRCDRLLSSRVRTRRRRADGVGWAGGT